LFEDRHHEFKNYWDIVNNNIAPIVMKYISAFLNSDGGVLYVGIDDNSVVSGFEMNQHEFDKFMLNIDSESKLNMLPPLLPHKYSIRRIPVINTKKGKELWVIEIKVTPSELDKRNRVLTLYNR
jgi:predicted HTH transcriptional regulator